MAAESSLLIALMSFLATFVHHWEEAGADASAAAAVMSRPAIFPDGSRVILISLNATATAEIYTPARPDALPASAFFNLPAAVTSPRKKGVDLSGGNACCIFSPKLAWMAGESSLL